MCKKIGRKNIYRAGRGESRSCMGSFTSPGPRPGKVITAQPKVRWVDRFFFTLNINNVYDNALGGFDHYSQALISYHQND